MRLMKLKLSAPLQSWGEDSRWDTRETAASPTKSAVIGMLGCALGYPRGDSRLVALDQALKLAVRIDQPGRVMTDFHTVTGTDEVLLTAAGSKRSSGATIITPRQYLQSSTFTVFLWGDEDTLTMCGQALLHPHWPIYLGRKSCVPSVPVIPQWVEANTVEEAVRCMTDTELKAAQDVLRVEIELGPGESAGPEETVRQRMDRPVRAQLNEYLPRSVRVSSFRKEAAVHVSE